MIIWFLVIWLCCLGIANCIKSILGGKDIPCNPVDNPEYFPEVGEPDIYFEEGGKHVRDIS